MDLKDIEYFTQGEVKVTEQSPDEPYRFHAVLLDDTGQPCMVNQQGDEFVTRAGGQNEEESREALAYLLANGLLTCYIRTETGGRIRRLFGLPPTIAVSCDCAPARSAYDRRVQAS